MTRQECRDLLYLAIGHREVTLRGEMERARGDGRRVGGFWLPRELSRGEEELALLASVRGLLDGRVGEKVLGHSGRENQSEQCELLRRSAEAGGQIEIGS